MPRVHTPKTRQKAAAELAAGKPIDRAAEAAGVDPSTIKRWRANDPGFMDLVREAEARQLEAWDTSSALAFKEIERRLREDPKSVDMRDLVGIATRAGHHTNLTLSRGIEVKPEQRAPLTPEQQEAAAEALREMAESAERA